jgi:acetyltransferase EpsM
MKKVIIFGGIGAASTIGTAIADANKEGYCEYIMCGYLNDLENIDQIDGFPIIGGKKDIKDLLKKDYYFINTVYKIDGQKDRLKLFESLQIPEDRLATFISPRAYVASNVKLSPGCVVMPNASISSGVKMGICCRVMSGALVGHDNKIGNHSFFAANSCVGSHLNIGDFAYFGLNCTVGGKLKIGNFSVVGMGSVVTKDVEDYAVVMGNPARFSRYVKDKE